MCYFICYLTYIIDTFVKSKFGSIIFALDIDECSHVPSVCHENAECINQEPFYNCECLQGYVGDGVEACDG